MPHPSHRKKPFSAKQKKEQLKAKRDRKRQEDEERDGEHEYGHRRNKGRGQGKEHAVEESGELLDDGSSSGEEGQVLPARQLNQQPQAKHSGKEYDPNRYRLHFQRESEEEISHRKKLATQTFQKLPEIALEIDLDDIYKPGTVLDMPQRPPWDYSMNRHKLLAREERYFREYLENVMEKYKGQELSYFELNLETWRQLWRVLEMADIVLLITDIRHPALHFSPAFYDYVTKKLNKHLILVLNKIDLAAPSLVVAWKHYFQKRFPSVHIVCFTSFPKDKEELEQSSTDTGKVLQRRRKRKGGNLAVGPKQLLKACESIVNGRVDLQSWRDKIEENMSLDESTSEGVEVRVEEGDGSFQRHEEFRDGVLTIGCCGYPNVGKSSLMNGLVGKKVVSVSRTPGHTKHFQTIFLTHAVKLCDSPGLVFPSLVAKPMQILAGIYPIAQVREPYTAVGYLAQRVPLPKLLRIRHPDLEDKGSQHQESEPEWSAMDICDAWAVKRGFLTAKAARPDVYRAANNILRLALEGRLCLCTRPPNYTAEKEACWEKHQETIDIADQQEMHRRATSFTDSESDDRLTDSDKEESGDGESEEEEESGAKAHVSIRNPFALLSGD